MTDTPQTPTPASDDSQAAPTRLANLAVEVAIIGAGPAGLMAAEVLQQAGRSVHVFDAMPSVGRKFLLAGKGGLNLTHSEPSERFVTRYGARQAELAALLQDFDAQALRAWAQGLGVDTFVGTSGRVFPREMKAAPLLRAWLHRLRQAQAGTPAVQFHMRHRWLGWGALEQGEDQSQGSHTLAFAGPVGPVTVQARSVVLALGGGSWARLGSDGAWVPLLAERGITVAPLRPANCGFDMQNGWTEHFRSRFAGQPFKSVSIKLKSQNAKAASVPYAINNEADVVFSRKGEFVATETGVEGSLVYAASAFLRECIAEHGQATFYLDLLPDMPAAKVLAEVSHPRGSRSLSSHLKSRLHLDGIKSAILHELLPKEALQDPARLAASIKSLPITLGACRPLDEAISSAGGVPFETLGADLMLGQLPGVFCAGEMLDWEAPTGGYLLQACCASGRKAGQGVAAWLRGCDSK